MLASTLSGARFASILSLVWLIPVKAQSDSLPRVTTLEIRRNDRTFSYPSATYEEENQIVSQTLTVARNLYVNSDLRKDKGRDLPGRLQQLSDDLAQSKAAMDPATFFGRLTRMFNLENDGHLSIRNLKPFSCFQSVLPVGFGRVNQGSHRKILVNAISQDSEMRRLAPEIDRVAVGDRLVLYDHKDPKEVMKSLGNELGTGNSRAAAFLWNLKDLATRPHSVLPVPKENQVVLTFKRRVDAVEYSVALPWLSVADLSCLGLPPPPTDTIPPVSSSDHVSSGASAHATDTSPDGSVTFETIKNEYGTFSILKISTFGPSVPFPSLINWIQQRVGSSASDGLVIDLRDNSGGLLSYAEQLVQLFTSQNVQPLWFRVLNNDLNRRFLEKSRILPDLLSALKTSSRSAEYSSPSPEVPVYKDNELGQHYFSPVALYVNANCASSCEDFSALFQDLKMGPIWSEDASTAGAGASSPSLSMFWNLLPDDDKDVLQKLPLGLNIGFAWGQMVHSLGHSKGTLVEERGIKIPRDRRLPPTEEDFLNALTDSSRFKVIAANLAKRIPSYRAFARIIGPDRTDYLPGSAIAAHLTVAGTDEIRIRSDGRWIETVHGLPYQEHTVTVPLDEAVAQARGNLGFVEIVGYRGGRRVWRLTEPFRKDLPSAFAFSGRAQSISPSQFTVFNSFPLTSAPDGWREDDGKLVIGTKNHYAGFIQTEASILLKTDSEHPNRIRFIATLGDRFGQDQLDVALFADGNRLASIPTMSGQLLGKSYELPVPSYSGQLLELRFSFRSETEMGGRNVQIEAVTVE